MLCDCCGVFLILRNASDINMSPIIYGAMAKDFAQYFINVTKPLCSSNGLLYYSLYLEVKSFTSQRTDIMKTTVKTVSMPNIENIEYLAILLNLTVSSLLLFARARILKLKFQYFRANIKCAESNPNYPIPSIHTILFRFLYILSRSAFIVPVGTT